ncbi:TraR/DksA C4-type zinc finger protein [Kaistia sp. MMO-174]|uniref:TraR/DksA C4-type zinc finger protein n=1 Tax=Kaistia sp. MMO-174 TaxID=3081256 RepID=UPI0030181E1B
MDDADRAGRLVLAEIEGALRRSRSRNELPASDVCLGCGEDIDAERRAAVPHARRCFDCQSALERKRRS